MSATKKVKISVTISADLIKKIDRVARLHEGWTRSRIIDSWLHFAARNEAEQRLERDTIAYYDGLSKNIKRQDGSWSEASARTFFELDIDG